jgi:hypothetical protein
MHKYNSVEEANGTGKQIPEYEEDSEKITIRVIAGDDQFPIRYVIPPTLIGRKDNTSNVVPGPGNLCFYSPFLSRKHAELVSLGSGSVALRDLGSSNGTFLNGVVVTPMKLVRLNDGDLIQFGTEDANQGIHVYLPFLDSVVICQFSTQKPPKYIPNNQSNKENLTDNQANISKQSKQPVLTSGAPSGNTSFGPMSKIADISRRLASLGIILNENLSNPNSAHTLKDDPIIQRLNDTLETVEQLLEAFDQDSSGLPTENNAAKRAIILNETIHTRPLIGTAMRIINVYEVVFCLLASFLVLVMIFH